MYLSYLENDQKHLFLALAYKIAMADGVFMDSEKKLLQTYCDEMYTEINEDDKSKQTDQIIAQLKEKCDDQVRRIVIFEAIGLAYCDGEYADSERRIVTKAADAFGIPHNFCSDCESAIKDYFELQNRINKIVIS